MIKRRTFMGAAAACVGRAVLSPAEAVANRLFTTDSLIMQNRLLRPSAGTIVTPLPTDDIYAYYEMQSDGSDSSGNGNDFSSFSGTWSFDQSGAPDGGTCAFKTNDDYGYATQPSNVPLGTTGNVTFCGWFKFASMYTGMLWTGLSNLGNIYPHTVAPYGAPRWYNFSGTGDGGVYLDPASVWGTDWFFIAMTHTHGASPWRVWHGFTDGTLNEQSVSYNNTSTVTRNMRYIGYHATSTYQLKNVYVSKIAIYTAAHPEFIEDIFNHTLGQ